ncbi:MarR family transcriptional regulator [Aurantimonas sp. A2-1-M11]|uniref:MarR family winged helix-turn-helix transcriptional regulator n=1 Tax=Aurantimonas sp. A2-1-M11 TaxID=3113712 RepID=UPI002F937503
MISTTELASQLEQIARRLHSQGYASKLFPAQWAALRYIHSAPVHLRTAIDLARFQGLASGAVARTVRTLITKGYVTKRGSVGRGRAEELGLTERGRALLKKDPLQRIAAALETLDEASRESLAHNLDIVIRSTRPDQAAVKPESAESQ